MQLGARIKLHLSSGLMGCGLEAHNVCHCSSPPVVAMPDILLSVESGVQQNFQSGKQM